MKKGGLMCKKGLDERMRRQGVMSKKMCVEGGV